MHCLRIVDTSSKVQKDSLLSYFSVYFIFVTVFKKYYEIYYDLQVLRSQVPQYFYYTILTPPKNSRSSSKNRNFKFKKLTSNFKNRT